MTTNAELAVQVRELRLEVEHLSELVDQVLRVQTFTVRDELTGSDLTGPCVVLSVDEQAGVGYVAPLSPLGLAVPLDQLK